MNFLKGFIYAAIIMHYDLILKWNEPFIDNDRFLATMLSILIYYIVFSSIYNLITNMVK